MKSVKAIRFGLTDGWESPLSLTVGLSYGNPRVQEMYERAVNVGQSARIFFESVRSLGMKGPENL